MFLQRQEMSAEAFRDQMALEMADPQQDTKGFIEVLNHEGTLINGLD